MRKRTDGVSASDLVLGALAGIAGTLAMSPVTSWLYRRESAATRRREEAIRTEPPFQTLAARVVETVGLEPTQRRKQVVASLLHWGYGMAWGALYVVGRCRWPTLGYGFGLPFGIAFLVLGDELGPDRIHR
jgi:hypothetical protein